SLSLTTFGELAWTMRGAGDVDADGYDDVVVGQYDTPAEAYIVLGPIVGDLDAAAVADATWTEENDYSQTGQNVEGGFDVDGDGFDDYIIGAVSANGGGLSSPGAAYV